MSTSEHSLRAAAAYELDRYDEVLKEAGLAIAADPEEANNYFYLAQALFQLGRHQEALEAIETAIAKDPDGDELGPERHNIFRSATMRLAYLAMDRPELQFASKEIARVRGPRACLFACT